MIGTCHYALFSYLTYTAPDFSNLKTLGYKLPKGWEVLAVSASHTLDEIEDNGYFGITFRKDKEVVFPHRGSVLKSETFIDSCRLAFTYWTISVLLFKKIEFTQFIAAKKFIDMVMKQLGDEGDIKYSFTGHSLGAPLGKISAIYYNTKARLFDNPGTKRIIDSEGYVKGQKKFDIMSYQGELNFINDCCDKYGEAIPVSTKHYDFDGDSTKLLIEILRDYFNTGTHALEYYRKIGCNLPEIFAA